MKNIIVDEEFRDLLPSLDEETYKVLEEDLLENGCRDALVLWGDILVDGHNRYEIFTKHNIPFRTVDMEFASREDALIWIISTQVSRRNLTPIQLSHYRGLHYITDKKIVSNKNGKNQYTEVEPQNEVVAQNEPQPKSQHTSARLAEKYKVSKSTIKRDAKLAAAINAIGEVSPTAKKKILSGESNIGKMELERLSAKPKAEIKSAAAEIENGAFGKKANPERASQQKKRPVEVILSGVILLNASIDKMSENFYSELPKMLNIAERAKVKKALDSCIRELVKLSNQI